MPKIIMNCGHLLYQLVTLLSALAYSILYHFKSPRRGNQSILHFFWRVCKYVYFRWHNFSRAQTGGVASFSLAHPHCHLDFPRPSTCSCASAMFKLTFIATICSSISTHAPCAKHLARAGFISVRRWAVAVPRIHGQCH